MEKKGEKASKVHVFAVYDGRSSAVGKVAGRQRELVDLWIAGSIVFRRDDRATLASTVEAIIADNWSGTCCPVYIVGDAFLGGE